MSKIDEEIEELRAEVSNLRFQLENLKGKFSEVLVYSAARKKERLLMFTKGTTNDCKVHRVSPRDPNHKGS